jgi:hypothetical protein
MQFTTIIVALFAAVAMAVPAAEPVADAAPAAQGVYCTKCTKGSQSCCGLTTCNIYPC